MDASNIKPTPNSPVCAGRRGSPEVKFHLPVIKLLAAFMRTDNTLNSHELLDAVARLCSNGESGRLQIAAGATKGAFFFKQGKLVDARMGPFTGFPAVNLAVSMGAAGLSFNPSIQPPASIFNLLNERIILKERFGIETVDRGDPDGVAESAESAFIPIQPAVLPEASFPNKAVTTIKNDTLEDSDPIAGEALPEIVVTPTFARPITAPLESKSKYSGKESGLVPQFLRVPGKTTVSYSASKNVFVRAGVILLIIVPTAVGIASYWSPRREATFEEASSTLPAAASPTPSLTPSVLHDNDDGSIVTEAPTKETRPATQPTPNEDISSYQSEETKSPPAEGLDTQAASPSASESNVPVETPVRKPLSRAIAVVVEINEGYVTEAYIQNRQPNLGAYEATALRLARQRRYPKDTNRRETLILHVTSEP